MGGGPVNWLSAIRRYLLALAVLNLLWEFAQMPLYTLARTGTAGQMLLAGLHCTAADVLIATAAVLAALVIFATAEWPGGRRWMVVVIAATQFGTGYTLFSEYLNTVVRHAWTYSKLMPILPWLGTGLSPLAQWIIIPPVALAWATGRLQIGYRPGGLAAR